MTKVTRTFARLPLGDLSAERFEDMCLQLVYSWHDWTDIRHYGKAGADGGIDIYAEYSRDGATNTVVVQCKRYKKISLQEMKDIVDDYIKKNPRSTPSEYILVLACDIGRRNHESLIKYAVDKGLHSVKIMGSAIIEAELYTKRPDMLYTFFDIKLIGKRSIAISRLKRRLSMKKKIPKEFREYLKPGRRTDVIVHDANRDSYPELDSSIPGISPWFRVGYHRPYFRGISFIMSIERVMYNVKTREWRTVGVQKETDPEDWISLNTYLIGNIPYDNIVDTDMEGDEYYNFPHIFCEFSNLGEPYEELLYETLPEDQEKGYFLDKEKRIK